MIYNAIYTIRNRESGDYRTFKLSTAGDNSALRGKRILALLTGPDNQEDYTSFAFVDDDTGQVHIWKRFRATHPERSRWQLYGAMCEQLLFGLAAGLTQEQAAKYQIDESRTCLRCNRPLTTPESIDRGIGPECALKMAA